MRIKLSRCHTSHLHLIHTTFSFEETFRDEGGSILPQKNCTVRSKRHHILELNFQGLLSCFLIAWSLPNFTKITVLSQQTSPKKRDSWSNEHGSGKPSKKHFVRGSVVSIHHTVNRLNNSVTTTPSTLWHHRRQTSLQPERNDFKDTQQAQFLCAAILADFSVFFPFEASSAVRRRGAVLRIPLSSQSPKKHFFTHRRRSPTHLPSLVAWEPLNDIEIPFRLNASSFTCFFPYKRQDNGTVRKNLSVLIRAFKFRGRRL